MPTACHLPMAPCGVNPHLTHQTFLYTHWPSAYPHTTYLTEEASPTLSHSSPWHMDWNPAHSGCWPKVWGCYSWWEVHADPKECKQWELTDHMTGTCLGDPPILGVWSPSPGYTPPPPPPPHVHPTTSPSRNPDILTATIIIGMTA